MSVLDTDLAKFIYTIVTTIVFMGLMWKLVVSAMDSLKRTKGSWKSVIDEIAIGLVVIVAYVIVIQTPLLTMAEYVKKPILAIWNLIIGFLRQMGFPI